MRKLIFLLSMFSALTVQSADIFITPDSSLVDAVRKAREMRRLGKATEVTIHLAAGTYYLYEPLRLRPEDSGLTIVGNGAVISGGMPVNSWKKQGKLLVADVPDFNGRPVDFRQLWVNGKKAIRARDVMDFEQMHRIMTYDKKNHVLWIPRKAVEKLKLQTSNFKLQTLEMVLHEMWCTSNLRIKSMSPQGDSVAVRFHNPEGPIQFLHPWPSPMTPDTKHPSPFYLTNAKELLDEPGEWYYDIRDHKLYYMPRADETSNVKLQTSNVKLQTSNFKLQTSQDTADVVLTADLKLGFVVKSMAGMYKPVTKEYGFFESFPAGIKYGWNVLASYVDDLKYVFSAEGAKSLGGFGAIGNLFPASWDWHIFWQMTAFLSIILAFMNILPIPALDGGHVLFLLYEIITRRKPSEDFMIKAEYVGFGLLILLLVVANLNDILRFLGVL